MNEVTVFDNPEFGSIRTVEGADGEPWFVGRDVAKALGYTASEKAVRTHVDNDDKGVTKMDTPGGIQRVTIINESGVYSLVFGSKLDGAKRFKRWVTHEVLPAIRKRGGYMASKPDETPEETMARAVLIAQDTIERQKRQIDEMRPKAVFADAVAASKTSILVGDMAKLLRQNGVDMGQRRLFAWLRENGYLMKEGTSACNMPTQRSMELGLFEIKETSITHSDGHITISKTPKVTGKGQEYLVNKFLGTSR